ncbi:MAG: PSD1 and planctomycete cytochrome C domain-containing protein [Planctomycetota bacterium]
MPVRHVLAAVLLTLSLCANVMAEDQSGASFSAQELEFFENKIRPVLANSCYACHSVDHLKEGLKGPKAGILLDSRHGVLDANIGDPGDIEDSDIINSVRYKGPTKPMPPDGKLPDNVIKDLEKWVEMGMPWPDESGPTAADYFDLEERRAEHWAWHMPRLVEDLPKAAGLDEKANVIDRFVEARLEEEGIKPGPRADRAVLIRRVTLDLIGLPPTPEEVRAFVNDDSPNAYEELVDRLLASPRFGEKWARHWLDLMRYAESYGHEFDFSMPDPWKYRDYVIRAWNDDLAYDRFVREHIAGDLIEPRIHPETQVNEAIKATAWWFLHEQTHAPTNVRQHESDRMDNQIDVMTKSFLGMTVSCARCHDHKFDAISDEDYYSLVGFMQSSRQQEAYLDVGGKIEAQIERVRAAVDYGQKRFDRLNASSLEPTAINHNESTRFEDFNSGSFNGWRTTGWAWGDKPTTPGQWDPASGKAAAVLPGVAHSGLLGDEAVGTIRSPEFDYTQKNVWMLVKGKGQARMIIDSYTMTRYNRLLFEGLDVNIDTKGKWQWIKIGANRDLYVTKSHKGPDGDVPDHRAHLEIVDDFADAHLIVDEISFGDRAPKMPAPVNTESVRPGADAQFAEDTERFRQASAGMPKPQRALAITDGTPEDSYLHIRGGWTGIGEDLPRRFLTALGGEEGTPAPSDASGRDELARRITDRSNPLTARVQVNRLWHHLFGRGISPTVDNLGVLGVAPSHPELLNHLAVVFMEEDGWSNKTMIKRIVMSSAYQRGSDKADSNAEGKDPTNILLHRQNIRRMTSETLRDSVLKVAGTITDQLYGPPVGVYLTREMQGRGRPSGGPLDGHGRRSIYVSVRRNFLSPMMLTFDAPIPFTAIGRRNVTNVPAQSLTLMNDPFIHDQSKKWAASLVKDGLTEPAKRIDSIFLTATGQAASDQERDAALAFLKKQAEQGNLTDQQLMVNVELWQQMCHVAYNLKGFLFIR